ncbi:MAG: adenosylhomocysteine nucleosidase [Frankiaceae bacterium]|nr:adenosylhomocysteine nucleosidase [Frankiaceae bacterium]
MSLLVVAALHEEVRYVGGGVEVLVTGVGKALAAATLASRLAVAPRPELVVNIGTAGALASSMAGVYDVDVVTQHDFPYAAIEALLAGGGLSGGGLAGAGGTPRGYRLAADSPPVAVDEVGGSCVLGTGDSFVSDAAIAMELAGRGIHLVDMEGYGLASVCAAFGVPLRCVKAVSDRADADAADSWLDLIDGCALALGDWLRDYPG